MSRLVLLLAIIAVAVLVYRSLTSARRAPPKRPRALPTQMLRCDYCGLHVPEEEALRVAGRNYCSEEHKRLDRDT
jgi:uncharacterized protein